MVVQVPAVRGRLTSKGSPAIQLRPQIGTTARNLFMAPRSSQCPSTGIISLLKLAIWIRSQSTHHPATCAGGRRLTSSTPMRGIHTRNVGRVDFACKCHRQVKTQTKSYIQKSSMTVEG